MKFVFLCAGLTALLSAQPAPKTHIDELLAGARARLEKSPDQVDSIVDMANALARRAREHSDPAADREAEALVIRALKLRPGDFEARKVRVIIRLHQQRYADALEEAQALNKQIPDDNLMYGLITDAQIGLGNYKEAEASAQRMIDMRQVSAPGLERGAKLRELIGYTEGAVDWWGSALRLTSATDDEERAYILVQVARLHRESGKLDLAARHAQQALDLLPNYPAALTELALVRIAEEKPAEAADLLRKRLALAPDLDSLYWLSEALADAKSPDAAAVAADFEIRALAHAKETGEATPLLILYQADHGKAAEAVRLAVQSVAHRHDADTLDAYAWALYASGDFAGAKVQIAKALAPGLHRALFFYHAAMISLKNKDLAGARSFWKQAAQANIASVYTLKLTKMIDGFDAK